MWRRRWSKTSWCRPSSAPSSTPISASRRRPTCRRSSACSTARWNGFLLFPAACRSPSAPAIVWSTARATCWRRRSGARSPPRPGCRRNCRRGRSCASAAPRSPRRRRRTPSVPAPQPAGAILRWPAIGPTPVCPPPSKARSAPATAPPNVIAEAAVMDDTLTHSIDERDGQPCSARQRARRPLGVRARGRRDHSGRIRAAAALSGRAGRCRARTKDRRLSAPHPGRPWRLAAVRRRRSRCQRDGEGLFRAQDDRRSPSTPTTCAAPARRCWPAAAPSAPMSSPASCWLCSASFPGARCR